MFPCEFCRFECKIQGGDGAIDDIRLFRLLQPLSQISGKDIMAKKPFHTNIFCIAGLMQRCQFTLFIGGYIENMPFYAVNKIACDNFHAVLPCGKHVRQGQKPAVEGFGMRNISQILRNDGNFQNVLLCMERV